MCPLCCSVLKVYGLKDSSGVHWFGQHGKPNGKELNKAGIPHHSHWCVPRILQGSARAWCTGMRVTHPQVVNLVKYFPSIKPCCFPTQIVDSPAEVADKADRIITMLPSSPNVIEVYTGSSGILKCVLVTTSMHMNCSADQNYVCIFLLLQKSEERLPTNWL